MVGDGWRWLATVGDGWRWSAMVGDSCRWLQMVVDGCRWLTLVGDGRGQTYSITFNELLIYVFINNLYCIFCTVT